MSAHLRPPTTTRTTPSACDPVLPLPIVQPTGHIVASVRRGVTDSPKVGVAGDVVDQADAAGSDDEAGYGYGV